MSSTSYLITGATRGIGKGLLASFLSKPNSTVIAGVRDPSAEASKSLSTLPVGSGSKLIIVKLDSTSPSDPAAALKTLETEHGLKSLDVVVANAGIIAKFQPALETPASDLNEVFSTNTVAPLLQLQGFWPLVSRSIAPKFFVVSSNIASLALQGQTRILALAYGVSKVAANFVIRKLHFENEKLIAVALHPGWVQTDMGWFAANSIGSTEVPVTVEDSAKGLAEVIDNTTREKVGGGFIDYTGATLPW